MNNRWHIWSFKTMANFGYYSVSIRLLMKSASIYSFAKKELSIFPKERIKNVLYAVEKSVLKNLANFTGKQLCGVFLIKFQTFSALQLYSK